MDWEHLDLAMNSKSDMYKIWRSKQHTGFFGTRVQVGKYSGQEYPDKKCPTCGRRETAEHILTCPNEDRTQLLVETTEDLSTWLSQEHLTDLELAYWIPKYIMMRGDKPFTSLGAMSPRMKALSISQDNTGWQNFMEGCISTHFYFIQHYHLALSGSYLIGSDWKKSLISKLLQSPICNGFTETSHFTTRFAGIYTRRTRGHPIDHLGVSRHGSRRGPQLESKFFLIIDFGNLTKSHIDKQQVWVIAIQAADTAGRRTAAAGSRAKRIRHKVDLKIPSRTKLGITAD